MEFKFVHKCLHFYKQKEVMLCFVRVCVFHICHVAGYCLEHWRKIYTSERESQVITSIHLFTNL